MVYSETVSTTLVAPDDGTYTKTWAALTGAGSAGLTIDQTGKITGTPTAAGVVTVALTVTDSYGNSKSGNSAATISTAAAPTLEAVPGVMATHYQAVKPPSEPKEAKKKAKK